MFGFFAYLNLQRQLSGIEGLAGNFLSRLMGSPFRTRTCGELYLSGLA
jgi:hypothetical protein